MASEERTLLRKKFGSNGLQEGLEENVSLTKAIGFIFAVILVSRGLGLGVAYLIYTFGKTSIYEAKIEFLRTNSLAWTYFAGVSISVLVTWLNMFPTYYKQKVMDPNAGNLRANLFIYKTNHQDGKVSPYVIMEESGGVGQYNLANRSLHHYVENSTGVLLCVLLAGFVFPFPAMVCTFLFVVGRLIHQVGYAEGGHGKHAPGFVTSVLGACSLEMLAGLAAYKACL